MKVFLTREEWLNAFCVEITPMFAHLGESIKGKKIRLTCGFPSTGSRGKTKRVGECWSEERSGDKHHEILISPVVADPVEVAAIAVHELCHVAAGIDAGHKGAFATLARAFHLEGKLTATVPGDMFKQEFAPIIKSLGDYPHAPLDPSTRKVQGTRMLLVKCPSCGCAARMTAKWINLSGVPTCGCGTQMESK